MLSARVTGWAAASLATVLIATATPAVALTSDETPAPSAEPTPAATAAPTETAEPEATPSAEPTATPDAATDAAPTTVFEAPGFEARLAAAADDVAIAAVGDLTVTAFDDYYADGVFDPTRTAVGGYADRKDAYRVSEALTSTGQRAFGTIDAAGDYVFSDLPVGETKIYFTHPNSPEASVFFDATGATSADDIERLPNGSVPIIGVRAIATVNVDEDGEAVVVGFAAAQAQVAVVNPDGTPAVGLTGVQFGSGGEWFDATEYAGLPGSYAAGAHVPDEIGVRLTAPAGYEVDEVTAIDSISSRALTVTERDGAYWIDSVGLSPNAARADFTVTLAELPTGDLTVTSFDDYYNDGVFDASKTALDGNTDRRNSRVYEAITSTGQRVSPTTDAQGDLRFTDLPVGETKVYFSHPNNPDASVFFDATDAQSADDIERLPNGSHPVAGRMGVATVTVDEDGEALVVGFSSAGAQVTVEYPEGEDATGLSGIEFGSGGEWFAASEYAGLPGTYAAQVGTTPIAHTPDEIGLRLDAPQGYEIDEVVAVDSLSFPARPLELTERDGAWWIDTVDLGAYFGRADFTVTLAEVPAADLEVTYFSDVKLNGVFDADVDLTAGAERVFLEDANGDWWVTSVNEEGTYFFPGAAIGPATMYAELVELPETPDTGGLPVELPEAATAVWDATSVNSYHDTVEAETTEVSFEGQFIDPVTGDTTPVTVTDQQVGVLPADLVEGEQKRFIGWASITQAAAVATVSETDGVAPVTGAVVEFFANGERAQATEEPGTGGYLATEDGEVAVFGAAEYGISVTPPAGFEVVAVEAISLLTGELLEVENASPALPETGRMQLFAAVGADYRVAPEQVGGPAGVIAWAVQVVATEVPPVTTPGTGLPTDPGADLPRGGGAAPIARGLAATGSDANPLAFLLIAGLLVGAGVTLRTVRRRA